MNVLLYAGENQETMDETLEWLNLHRDCIEGVSAGPVVVYGRGEGASQYIQELATLGASPVDSEAADRDGYSLINLSPTIDHESANQRSINIAKSFTTDRDYYDLKSFTYLPRGYSFEDFQRDGEYIDLSLLPLLDDLIHQFDGGRESPAHFPCRSLPDKETRMIEVYPKLFVGSQQDYELNHQLLSECTINCGKRGRRADMLRDLDIFCSDTCRDEFLWKRTSF